MEGRDASDGERWNRDVRLDVCRLDETVVGGVRTAEREAEEADRLAVTDILVGEGGSDRRAIDADRIVGKARDRTAREGRGVRAVVGLVLGRDAGNRAGERGDREGADHRGRTIEVTARDRERSRRGGIITDAQITAGTIDGVGRAEGEGHRTSGTVRILEGVTRAADRRQAGEDLAVRGEVFDTADIERGRRSVGGCSVGSADEELAGWDNGVISGDVVHRVILGAQAGSLQDARIVTCQLHQGITTRDDERTTDHRGGVRPDEASEADTVEVRGIEGRD